MPAARTGSVVGGPAGASDVTPEQSAAEVLAQRREQNKLAQRRFRERAREAKRAVAASSSSQELIAATSTSAHRTPSASEDMSASSSSNPTPYSTTFQSASSVDQHGITTALGTSVSAELAASAGFFASQLQQPTHLPSSVSSAPQQPTDAPSPFTQWLQNGVSQSFPTNHLPSDIVTSEQWTDALGGEQRTPGGTSVAARALEDLLEAALPNTIAQLCATNAEAAAREAAPYFRSTRHADGGNVSFSGSDAASHLGSSASSASFHSSSGHAQSSPSGSSSGSPSSGSSSSPPSEGAPINIIDVAKVLKGSTENLFKDASELMSREPRDPQRKAYQAAMVLAAGEQLKMMSKCDFDRFCMFSSRSLGLGKPVDMEQRHTVQAMFCNARVMGFTHEDLADYEGVSALGECYLARCRPQVHHNSISVCPVNGLQVTTVGQSTQPLDLRTDEVLERKWQEMPQNMLPTKLQMAVDNRRPSVAGRLALAKCSRSHFGAVGCQA
ncbi:hypothetical protein IE81DRAFT_324407, partial [Ceraceosorus guamensis]